MNNLSKVKGILKSGARLNKYRVLFAFPGNLKVESSLEELSLLCKSASAPAMSIGVVEVSIQGRKLRLPGETSYEGSWTCEFYLNEDHKIRRDLIQWMKATDNFQRNTHSGNPAELLVALKIEQLDSAQNPVVTYTLHGCFPTSVGELSYVGEEGGQVATCSVTFNYTHWTVGEDENTNLPETHNKPTENILAIDK